MYLLFKRGRCGRDGMDLQLPVQSMPITIYVVSSNPAHVLNTTLCDCDLCKVGGFCQLFQFPLPVELNYYQIAESHIADFR